MRWALATNVELNGSFRFASFMGIVESKILHGLYEKRPRTFSHVSFTVFHDTRSSELNHTLF
jgi:hypothetical protein